MSLDSVATILKQGGIALLALIALGYVVKRIGERMILSIDRSAERHDHNSEVLGRSLTASTTTITSTMTSTSVAIVEALHKHTERLSRIEGALLLPPAFDEDTPVGGGPFPGDERMTPIPHVPRHVTPAKGVATGYRPPARPPTNRDKP